MACLVVASAPASRHSADTRVSPITARREYRSKGLPYRRGHLELCPFRRTHPATISRRLPLGESQTSAPASPVLSTQHLRAWRFRLRTVCGLPTLGALHRHSPCRKIPPSWGLQGCNKSSDTIEITPGKFSIGTIQLAKGLEFRAVAVVACDDEVIPSQERIENVADDADLEEVYDSERHLLYVACTRARDHLLVTGVKPASEFIGDLVN
jgi:hypothetical protein